MTFAGHKTSWFLIIFVLGLSWTPVHSQEEDFTVLTEGPDGVQRGTLILESYTFIPRHLVVNSGAAIELTLRNTSFLVPHNFILDAVGGGVEQEVSAGEDMVVRFTLPHPGVYHFYCDKQLLFFPSHREEGMEGRIEAR